MFISPILRNDRYGDHYYCARRSLRTVRYLWSRVPLMLGPERDRAREIAS